MQTTIKLSAMNAAFAALSVALGTHAFAAAPSVYLALDGNLLDASGNGHHGTLIAGPAGTASYVTGHNGQGLDFNMNDESVSNLQSVKTDHPYVSVSYTLPDDGTISLWVKAESTDFNYQSVFDNSADADYWEAWIDAGFPDNAGLEDTPSVRFWPNGDWPDGVTTHELGSSHHDAWMHLAVTWDRDGTSIDTNLYVNGDLKATTVGQTWEDPGSSFYLAGGNAGNNGSLLTYDELAIYEQTLSAGEVSDLYQNGVPEPMTLVLLASGGVALAMRRRCRW